jgi:hypothetical protein
MGEWLHERETLLWWVGALSILMCVGTLVALPLVVARLPADYFRRDHYATRHQQLDVCWVSSARICSALCLSARVSPCWCSLGKAY